MQKVTITGNTATFRGNELTVIGFKKVDAQMFDLVFDGHANISFILGEVEINDVRVDDFASIPCNEIVEATPPDWHGLEQSLRYAHDAALFGKAFATASDKGLNLFMVTLLNGKRGDSSENSLAFAFSVLGVDWTTQEKSQINQILTDHNFTIQI